ncbi:hypothetical protein DOY81_002929, partial [Sarcophaga bullata]
MAVIELLDSSLKAKITITQLHTPKIENNSIKCNNEIKYTASVAAVLFCVTNMP